MRSVSTLREFKAKVTHHQRTKKAEPANADPAFMLVITSDYSVLVAPL